MSQQVNLYNPALLPQADVFGGRAVLLGLAGTLGLALLTHGWATWDDARLTREQQRQEGALVAAQSDIARLAQDVAAHKASAQLTAELESMDAMLAGRSEIMTVLKGGSLGDTRGVSQYFRAFANETVDGLWLTGFSIVGAGKDISIEGRALRAELVPGYIGKLRRQDVLRGHGFASLNVQVPVEAAPASGARKTAEFLEFRMSSQGPGAAAGPLPGGTR